MSGSWSGDASGSASCVTDANGQCTVSVSGIPKRSGTVAFTVADMTHSDLSYDSSVNHDPDGGRHIIKPFKVSLPSGGGSLPRFSISFSPVFMGPLYEIDLWHNKLNHVQAKEMACNPFANMSRWPWMGVASGG